RDLLVQLSTRGGIAELLDAKLRVCALGTADRSQNGGGSVGSRVLVALDGELDQSGMSILRHQPSARIVSRRLQVIHHGEAGKAGCELRDSLLECRVAGR